MTKHWMFYCTECSCGLIIVNVGDGLRDESLVVSDYLSAVSLINATGRKSNGTEDNPTMICDECADRAALAPHTGDTP
jgi:hypothetical protein